MLICAIDDEPLALEGLLSAIREAEPAAALHGFSRPQALLEFAATNAADIAFLDIRMKTMTGLALAERLKALNPLVNIVFVTGYSEYMEEAFALYVSGYVQKPVTAEDIRRELNNLRHPLPRPAPLLTVRCFGNFEVFAAGSPLSFPRSKAKELFAYLIHRRGGGCTSRELAAVLFEDKAYGPSTLSQLQNNISALIKTLEGKNAGPVILRSYNSLSVDADRLDCDFYHFLRGENTRAYTGEYLAQYPWAEFTLGYLDQRLKR